MNNDMLPQPQPQSQPQPVEQPRAMTQPTPQPQQQPGISMDISPVTTSLSQQHNKPAWKSPKFIASLIVLLISVIIAGCIGWYNWALTPRDSGSTEVVRVVVNEGDGVSVIADDLASKQIIKSKTAFRIYTELSGQKRSLQAGGYALSPSESVQQIVDHLTGGKVDEINVFIAPGLSLDELADPDIEGSLANQGYEEQEIRSAYDKEYSHPVLAGRPAGASLEGYLFPDTYRMNANDPVDVLFEKSFDELESYLDADDLRSQIQAQGLTVFQAVTLASIVQEEDKDPANQRQIAQVFLKRLREGIMLGSDVTFMYAANQLGVEPTINIDSPYNTRRYTGLPPGPISNFNIVALQAVANPAPGDFLFFVAGDGEFEGTTYFARTDAEHEQNVENYCSILCR